MNQRNTPTPLPASAWGTEAAKVAAHEDWAYAQGPAAQADADLAAALRRCAQEGQS